MSYTSNNAVSNGLVGSTVTIGTIGSSAGHIPTSGQFLTSSGSNGTSYTNTWTTGTTTTPYDTVLVANQNPASLEVKGRLVHNGRDLEERLNTIEKVLRIPERDVKLEKKHPKLKKLYDEYIAALGKYRTFEAIKGDEDGTT
jgi:hypothetical protein